jgi:superfamily II DNA/RNA helicase
LNENKSRKIVIFSYFATTVEYVYNTLKEKNYRVLLYTGGANKADRTIVRQNFDASYRLNDQKDDFDIIVATDALSEGFNLNRAGVVINYDLPYNPTRVVQRIGRINRINKMLFDKIYIYNFFPTEIGEENIGIKSISTLKMLLINNIVGSDTPTLTPEEDLKSYFKKRFDEADSSPTERSWDIEYKNDFNYIKHNDKLLEEVQKIPERVRIVRKNQDSNVAISFVKRGNHSMFAIAEEDSDTAEIKSAYEVLHLFKAEPDEVGYEFDDALEQKFTVLKEKIHEAYPKVKIDPRKSKAIENLNKLREYCQTEKDYINDLLEIIKEYDDLCDSELKYIANLTIRPELAKKIVEEIKIAISEHYIIEIKTKAEQIKTMPEIIMFTEDLRK